MARTLRVTLCLLALTSLLPPIFATRIDLFQKRAPEHRHLDRRDGAGSEQLSLDEGFWFGNFTIGGSSDLTMLIDTGSSDVIINPTFYKPSKTSRGLNISFSNHYGTTSSDGTGTGELNGTLYTDEMTFQGLTANQTIGSAIGDSILPHQGIVGFAGQSFAQFPTNSTSFMQSLCDQQVLSECRFGLALNLNGTGTQILGELDSSLYEGTLSVGPLVMGIEWAIFADLTINGTVVANDLVVELDSGTATIIGPIDAVSSIFNATGIQSYTTSTSEGNLLTGFFPCDRPPTVGLSFPSQANTSAAVIDSSSPVSRTSTNFDIPLDVWAAIDNGNNNCTAVLSGQDYAAFPGLWVVGQPFFSGLYLDHNLENGTVGFAHQKVASALSAPSATPSPSLSKSSATGIEIRSVLIVFSCVLLSIIQ